MTSRAAAVTLLAGALLGLGACTPPPEPDPVPVRAPTVAPTVAPKVLVDGVARADLDLCAAIKAAKAGTVITVRGDRATPIDLSRQPSTTATAGRCVVAASVPDVTVRTEGRPLILGQLQLSNTDGWLLDGLALTPAPGADHGALLQFVGGSGWRLTNCELFDSASMTDLSVGHWTGSIPTDFEVDHCFIHDNPGRPDLASNQNDNAYIFTADGVDARGYLHDNLFVAAPRGVNVKIGGTGLRPGEGSDGIRFEHNTLVNYGATETALLISTDSDDVTVHNNIFVSQGGPALSNVVLGSFTGSGIEFRDNLFWGYDPQLWPKPRPILWAYAGEYASIDLNESTSYLDQRGSIRYDPGYPALSTHNPDPGRFPSVVRNGVTYGRTP